MRLIRTAALVIALAILSASGQAQGSVDAWLNAVRQHTSGATDAHVYVVADWSRQTLISILRDVTGRNADGALNPILIRAAQLHSDIGLRVPARARGLLEPDRGGSGTMLALDGREEGVGQLSFHLDFARALLNAVKPRPSDHDDVRKWYRKVAAQAEQIYNLADAVPHLRRAREILVDDPEILLASGCLYETLSSPRVQSVMQSLAETGRPTTMLADAGKSRSEAARYFRRALAVSPSTLEAKVRLARLLGIDGRHADAEKLLKNAVVEIKSDQALAYYAWLFLGDELQATRQFTAAAAAYQGAANLYPRAQSPRLALVCLAKRVSSRANGFELMQQTLGQSARTEGEDPWWRYYEGTGRALPPPASPLRLARALGDRP
jgi:AraC-like DNA-binding protein